MGRVPHFWREAYELALREADPSKVIGHIEYAMIALERRYSELGTDPGTPAELTAIEERIFVLERLMKHKHLGSYGAALSTAPRDRQKEECESMPLITSASSNIR
jgi:hypothetical protein